MRRTSRALFSLLSIAAFTVSGCGSITGIPGHGGGKRFAVEQELLASTVRAVTKDIDVSALAGRRVAIYFVGIGDQGSGNIVGGRYSVAALVRGGYLASAPNEVVNTLPPIDRITNSSTTNTTTTGDTSTTATTTSNTTSSDLSDYPERSVSEQSGNESAVNAGLAYNGIGNYTNNSVLNPRDYAYLSGVIQKGLILRGIKIVDPSDADVDLYVTVDVFGTIRSRHDWHVVNQESLIAKTSIEMAAIERDSGAVVIPAQISSFEAEYNEQYVAWAGPVHKIKELRRSDGILTDFTTMDSVDETVQTASYPDFPLQSPRPKPKATE